MSNLNQLSQIPMRTVALTEQDKAVIRKNKLKRALFIIAMIIVPLANFFVFYISVNINSILMAFQTVNGDWTFEVLGNVVERIFGDQSDILTYLGNTLIYFLNSIFVMMPLITGVAYFIYKKIFLYKFFRVIFFLPSIVSSLVFVMLYKEMWAAGNGPMTKLMVSMFNLPENISFLENPNYTKWVILVYTIWTGFGTNLILMTGAMNRIPEEVLEAGALDGVGNFKELTSIILPLIWPTLTTLLVLAFTGIFTASGPLLLFSDGEYDTMTISYYIFREVKNGGDLNFASAMGLFFTAVGLPIIMGVRKLLERLQDAIEY